MKIVSFEDVKSLKISPAHCYEWVSDMIERKQETFLPAKTHMDMPGNIFCNIMPSLVPVLNASKMGRLSEKLQQFS